MGVNSYDKAVSRAKRALREIRAEMDRLNKSLTTAIQLLTDYGNKKTPSTVEESLKKQVSGLEKVIAKQKELSKVKDAELIEIQKLATFVNKIQIEQEKASNKKIAQDKKELKERQANSKKKIALGKKELKEREAQVKKESDLRERLLKQRQREERAADRLALRNKHLNRSFIRLLESQKRAKNTLQDLITGGKKANQTQLQYNKTLLKAQARYNSLTKKVNAAKRAVSNFSNTGLGNLLSGARNLITAFGIIGGATLFASTIKNAFDLTKKLDAMRFSMRAVIKDHVELSKTQGFLRDISIRFGAELVTVTNRYIKFRAATQQAGLSAKETQDIFGTMTKAAGVLGLKTDELQGIFLALEQMVSKGKITTEELRRQLGERLPGAMDIMANSLGVTTAKLDEMLKKGQVITKDVLPGFAREVEKAFGLQNVNRVETLQAATTRLGNAWVILIEEFNKGSDASSVLMRVFDTLANNLGTIVTLALQAAAAFVTYKAVTITARLGTILFSKVLWVNINAWIWYQRETIKATLATKSFTRALLTNPIFLAIAVLTALFFLFRKGSGDIFEATKELSKFNREATETAEKTADLNQETTELIKKYRELKEELQDLPKETEEFTEKTKELNDIIITIGSNFKAAINGVDAFGNASEISAEKVEELVEASNKLLLSGAAARIETETESLRTQRLALEEIDKVNNKIIGSVEGIGDVTRRNGTLFEVTTKGRKKSLRELTKTEIDLFNTTEAGLRSGIASSIKTIERNEDIQASVNDILNDRQLLEAWEKDVAALKEKRAKDEADAILVITRLEKERDEAKVKLDVFGDKDLLTDKDLEKFEEAEKAFKDAEKALIEFKGQLGTAPEKGIIALKGSISAQEAVIKKLEEQRIKLAITSELWDKFTEDIDNAKAHLSRLEDQLKGTSDAVSELLSEGVTDVGVGDTIGIDEELIQQGLDLFIDAEDKKEKRRRERLKTEAELAAEAFELSKDAAIESWSALGELGSAFFDRRIQRYDDEIQKNNDFYAEILDNENLSQEQRSALEAERDAKNAILEKKKREQQRKQAVINKITALGEIAINTAIAVTKVLGQTGIFGIAASIPIIALGALQAAIVLATPIPKFAEGKGAYDNYEGVAVWGEKRQEAKISKDGRVEISPKTIGDHLTYVKKDDIIHPNADKLLHQLSLSDIDMKPYLFSHPSYMNNYLMMGDLFVDRMDTQTNRMVDAINRKKMSFKLNQTISLAEDIAFIMSKNDTL